MMSVKVSVLMSLPYEASRDGLVKEQRCLFDVAASCQGQRDGVKDGGCPNVFHLHTLLKYVRKDCSAVVFKSLLSLNLIHLTMTMP